MENEESYFLVKADKADRETNMPLFEKEKFEFVTHLSAESDVNRSITDLEIFVRPTCCKRQVELDLTRIW